jgi:hypothetical protein
MGFGNGLEWGALKVLFIVQCNLNMAWQTAYNMNLMIMGT